MDIRSKNNNKRATFTINKVLWKKLMKKIIDDDLNKNRVMEEIITRYLEGI